MRRFLSIFGALMLIVIAAAGVGLGVLFYKGPVLDSESKAYVDSAVPAIAATWSPQELLDRATPELRQIFKSRREDLSALFAGFSRLGALLEYEGATGEALLGYVPGSGITVSASYLAKARFQNGAAASESR
jgi:hypothetical protein